MITSVLFVHGTGVRKASYERACRAVARGLSEVSPTIRLEPCLWGDVAGASLNLNGVSIPEFLASRQIAEREDDLEALWSLLYRDPFFELRELTAADQASLLPPSEHHSRALMVKRLQNIALDTAILSLFSDIGFSFQWSEAVESVVRSPIFKSTLEKLPKLDSAFRIATSRAIVAAWFQKMSDDNMPIPPQALRERIIDECVDRLGGRELGVTSWIANHFVGLGLHWATVRARRKRDVLFSAVSPVAGDILLYQARGDKIRTCIEQRIRQCEGQVAILAHSLGGIACLDLLLEKPMPQVDLLVTAGSQAPFLFEIGALQSMQLDDPFPEHFKVRWVNFFDYNDLLSFKAKEVFDGRATDHLLSSGQPFPQSHGAYWDNPDLWQKLKPYLEA